MTDDLRRRQYVPLDVYFMSKKTGTRIQQKYGLEGIGVFVATLAAAKRSSVQGTILWNSEGDAWAKLGLTDATPHFTFQDFVTTLGHLKQTRTRRIGQLKETRFTRWEEWNKEPKRKRDASRNRWKRAKDTGDDPATIGRHSGDDPATEGEGEGDPPTPMQKRTNPRRRPTRNGLVCPHCGVHPANPAELQDHLELFHPETLTAATNDLPL